MSSSMLKIVPCPSLNVTVSANKKTSIYYSREDNYETEAKIKVWDQKGKNKIAQIFISYGDDYIKSLAFQYLEEDGTLKLSSIFGCQNLEGSSFETLTFKVAGDTDDEYITRVSGSHDMRGLKSLTIETNLFAYGPFGIADNCNDHKKFHIGLGSYNQFGGFHGTFCTSPEFITSIGVYLEPIRDLGGDLNIKKTHDDLSIHYSSLAIDPIID